MPKQSVTFTPAKGLLTMLNQHSGETAPLKCLYT
nr:MAG TPA: hypothetical protein [Caudoviricetes sp.]